MSNYTPSTNFATKDALSPGDPLKIVRGTEINTEFVNIATAVATKFDTTALASPGPIGATTPSSINGTTGTFSGNVQMASANGGQLAGLRNRIINGDTRVLQRGTGSVTTNVAGTAFYVADRFFGATLATGAVVAAGNSPSGALSLSGTSTISLQTSTAKAVLTANDFAFLSQLIEGNNVSDLKFGTASAKTVTISFRARADNIGSTAVITVTLRNGANNRAYCAPVTITNANASYSVTIPGDTSGTWLTDTGIGLKVNFGFAGSGTSVASADNAWIASAAVCASTQTNFLGTATASLNITDVQLEVGPVATPFEQRPVSMELALCQRYFQAFAQSSFRHSSFYGSTGGPLFSYLIPPMRAVPTIVQPGTWNAIGITGVVLSAANNNSLRVSGSVASSAPYSWEDSGTLASASAELF